MSSFRRAARALRATLEPAAVGAGLTAGRASALSVLIEGAGQAEMVSMRMRDGVLDVACTCGAQGCTHAHEALALFDEEPRAEALEDRITHMFEPAMRVSDVPEMPGLRTAPEGRNRLSDVLADIVLAVTRSGVQAGISAGVSEALERLAEHASTASATGLRVWVGTLKSALEAHDNEAAVRALAAASAMLDALRKVEPPAIADAHVVSWLGTPASGAMTSERGDRAHVTSSWRASNRAGLARAGVEQRYLIDLATGELFREDRADTETASLGPCPRLVSIGLAHTSPATRRGACALLQYTTTPLIDRERLAEPRALRDAELRAALGAPQRAHSSAAGLTDMLALGGPRACTQATARTWSTMRSALVVTGAEGTANRSKRSSTAPSRRGAGRVHAHANMLR